MAKVRAPATTGKGLSSTSPAEVLIGPGGLHWRRWPAGWFTHRAGHKAIASRYAGETWTLKIKRNQRTLHTERCPDLESMMRRGFRLLNEVDAPARPRPLDTARRLP